MVDEKRMGKRVRRAYPGSYYDTAGLERWLEQLALEEGLLLEDPGFMNGLLSFRRETPRRVRYFAAPILGRKKKERAAFEEGLEQQCEELGWKLIFSKTGVVKVYESTDPWAIKPKVRVEDEDWAAREKVLRNQLLGWIVSIILAGVQVWGDIADWNLSYRDTLTGGYGLILMILVVPLLSFAGAADLYNLHVVRRLRQDEQFMEHHGFVKGLRWVNLGLLPTVIVVILVAAFVSMGATSTTYRPVDAVGEELPPLVTVQLVDDSLFCDPEQYRRQVLVSVDKHLLLPREVHIDSYGCYNPADAAEADWWDANHDAEMRFSYYRLWDGDTARRLAEDELSDYDGIAPAADAGSFDALWYGVDETSSQWPYPSPQPWQRLAAASGKEVIVVHYTGPGDLRDCAPVLYDTLLEYRTHYQ